LTNRLLLTKTFGWGRTRFRKEVALGSNAEKQTHYETVSCREKSKEKKTGGKKGRKGVGKTGGREVKARNQNSRETDRGQRRQHCIQVERYVRASCKGEGKNSWEGSRAGAQMVKKN